MKTNKKIIIIIICIVSLIIISTATYTIASGSDKYKEPAKKPAGLPTSAKFNPETGNYFDSDFFEWDSNTQTYKDKPPQIPENYQPPRVATMTIEEWANSQRDSTDKIDIALLKYNEAMSEYWANHPELGLSSRWEVGQDGGPLTILTDLGVAGLPGLIKHVNWEDPFVVPVMIAVEQICKTRIGDIYPDEVGVTSWKNAFNAKVSSAKYAVDSIVQELATGAINDAEINSRFAELGIFALPSVYDEIVNKSNTGLAKYIYNILPDSTLKKFNLQSDSLDIGVLRKALETSKDEVEIIKTLSAE